MSTTPVVVLRDDHKIGRRQATGTIEARTTEIKRRIVLKKILVYIPTLVQILKSIIMCKYCDILCLGMCWYNYVCKYTRQNVKLHQWT